MKIRTNNVKTNLKNPPMDKKNKSKKLVLVEKFLFGRECIN